MKVEAKETVELLTEDITKIQFERDLSNKKEELLRGELNLKEHEEILVEFNILLPLIKVAGEHLGTPEMCKILKPVYAYEEDEHYIKMIAQQKRIEYVQTYYSMKDKSIKGLVDTIKAKKDNIQGLKDVITKMEK